MGHRRVGKTTLLLKSFEGHVGIDKGQNETDLVATNPLTRSVGFAEVNLNPAKFSAGLLELKIGAFLKSLPQYRDWNITRQGLSLENLRNI